MLRGVGKTAVTGTRNAIRKFINWGWLREKDSRCNRSLLCSNVVCSHAATSLQE